MNYSNIYYYYHSNSLLHLLQVLIMSPTRELAKQIVEEFQTISKTIKLRIQAIYGGTSLQENYSVLQRGVDVVVGTPGRIKDLLDRKWLSLSCVRHVVLDEADQMLDMGFTEEIQAIFDAFNPKEITDNFGNYGNDEREQEFGFRSVGNTENSSTSNNSTNGSSSSGIPINGVATVAKEKQVLLFSATMPRWVHGLADKYLRADRVVVDLVTGTSAQAVTTIQHIAIPAHWTILGSVINDVIAMFAGRQGRVMVFASTKLDCDTIAMDKTIKHECHVLHGDIPQPKREATLAAYKAGNFRVLICTDVAARGLDLSVELVIQSKPPCRMNGKTDVETYVHRSGRTGRAGKAGVCVT